MMLLYVRLYFWYRTALVRSLRLLAFVLLLFIIFYSLGINMSPTLPQFLFNLLVIFEVFFHYHVCRIMPPLTVDKNKSKDLYESFTREAVSGFITESTTPAIMKKIVHYPAIKQFLQKADITPEEMIFTDIPKQMLIESAFDTAKTFKGKYVTTVDLLVAYLFLTEKDTKLFFAKQLRTTDIANLMTWIRNSYPDEENPKKARFHISGRGIGDELVSGWTPETKKYTANFTNLAIRDEPLIIGREVAFKAMLENILKLQNNNILLVGDIGAGKENLVKALAYHSFMGNLVPMLNYKRFFQLLVGSLTAGASTRNDLETRLQSIIAEISHSTDVVLYIPEFQNILGATSYNLDLSGALLPYLNSGNMPVIATMSTGNYKAYMDRNSLKEVFTVIQLPEPDKDTATQMILTESDKIEKKYKVILSYRAIASSVHFAERFLQDEVLPGSAIALLDSVSNAVSLDTKALPFGKTRRKMVLEKDVIKKVEETVHVRIAAPTQDEINLLLHLEDKLHERLIAQDAAIIAVSEAMRRLRAGVMGTEKPISFLFLGPTGVGKTETAKTLAQYYYGNEKNLVRFDMSEYKGEDGMRRLLGAPPGQGEERGELTEKVRDNPSSLILLDEFEKAHISIHDLFLQVLDDGRLTDNKGQTVSFRNSIIIATSNAGSELIREEVEKGTKFDKQFQSKLLDYLQSKAIFKPELLNRFDDVIIFRPLDQVQVVQVVKLLLKQLSERLQEQDITVTFDDAVIEKIASEGFDQEFGARPLRRYIQDNVEDLLAQHKLTNEISRGKSVSFFINGTGALDISVT